MKKNEKKEPNKKKTVIHSAVIWLLYIAAIAAVTIIVFAYGARNNATNTKDDDETAQAVVGTEGPATEPDTPGRRTIGDRIVVPSYEDITVTSDQPLMGFDNPMENEDAAVLRYTVDANYDSKDVIPLIQEEMWILPGKTLPIDIHSQLKPGVYDVRISILAKDPEQDYEIGTDVQYITVTVE